MQKPGESVCGAGGAERAEALSHGVTGGQQTCLTTLADACFLLFFVTQENITVVSQAPVIANANIEQFPKL